MDLRPYELGPLRQVIASGMDSWRAFAPEGWEPPGQTEEPDAKMRERLARPGTWCRIAWEGEEPAGAVGVAEHDEGHARAYLWLLFVRTEWWGTGLARRLHAAALAEMEGRGHTVADLWTPRENRRARRFYEREGWRVTAAERPTDIGLPEVQYSRDLTPS